MSSSTSQDPRQVLNRFAMYAAVFVVGGAVLFGLIGAVSGDDQSQAEMTEPPMAASSSSETPQATGQPTGDETDDSTGEIVNPSASDEPEGTQAPTDEPTDDGPRIPASDVSIQVLDGKLDGSSTAQDLYDRLGDDGHEQIAYNNSSRVYDETTVFYSPGFEDAANQMAADNGWNIVRPGSDVGLSDAAALAIVVGLDEG